jgi:hypothetical protein
MKSTISWVATSTDVSDISARRLLFTGTLLGSLFDHEYEGDEFFRNVGERLPNYTA